MSVIGSAEPDVVRIKVYKPNDNPIDKGYEHGASKKFCIDPRLASYQTIQILIAQAFDLKSDFTIYSIDRCSSTGLEKLSAIWTDWDLEEAIKNVTSDSYLRLSYSLTHKEDSLDDWDFVALNDFNSNIRYFNVDNRSIIATVQPPVRQKPSALSKAINWMYGGHERRSSKPVDENEYRKCLDNEGRIINVNELRQAIYLGGIEPSIRKLVWRHLLNIFPINMTSLERNQYLTDVHIKYEKLKGRWKDEQQHNENIRKIMRLVHTDVIRTDRTCGFYANLDDNNVNLQSLYNILMTYCVNHPNTTYCQGMNEYASSVLYVMREESLAYVCFCSIMRRIRANFATDGVAIATKLHHLKLLLKAIDPVYWNLLESCDAVSLYFTYRWLLLDCKREFPFNDALRVFEVMWATLPIANEPPALSEISILTLLTDSPTVNIQRPIVCRLSNRRRALSCPQFSTIAESSSHIKRNYTSSSIFDNSNDEQLSSSLQTDFYAMMENDPHQDYKSNNSNSNYNSNNNNHNSYDDNNNNSNKSSHSVTTKLREKLFENSFSLSEISDFNSNDLSNGSNDIRNSNTSDSQYLSKVDWVERLPENYMMWLEEDNLFLLFLCISILLAHRTHLLKQKDLDEQDISMHFDRYRRANNAERLLRCARAFYAQYIQWARKKRMLDDLNIFSVS